MGKVFKLNGTSIRSHNEKKNGHQFTTIAWLLILVACILLNAFVGHHITTRFRNRQIRHYVEVPRVKDVIPFSSDGAHAIHDGESIAKILRGENQISLSRKLKYRPGTLPMSSKESLHYCYVNTTQYVNHLQRRSIVQVSISEQHKLIYRNVPKSSSSSARYAMRNIFGGVEMMMPAKDLTAYVREKNFTLISFIRDPLERFYSSYDESFFRMGPWFGEGPLVANRPGERKGYHENKYKVKPYPYLFEGMKTFEDYRRRYCKVNGQCDEGGTIDDGDLVRRFERFVDDYNGLDPFDIHLHLQVSFFSIARTGEILPFSNLYNASEAAKEWGDIINARELNFSTKGLVHGRKSPRRFNMNLVTEKTKRKICRLMALDYCCLNLILPDVCRIRQDDDESGVFCTLERNPKEGSRRKFLIHPWNTL